jgi:hypothetical protein
LLLSILRYYIKTFLRKRTENSIKVAGFRKVTLTTEMLMRSRISRIRAFPRSVKKSFGITKLDHNTLQA